MITLYFLTINPISTIKNRSILFLAGLISVFASCKNDGIKVSLDKVVLNHKNSGSFSATISNSENTPYVGKEVQLFNEVKIDNYSVVVYTDESHFEMASLDFFTSSRNYFYLGQDKTIEKDAVMNAANVRDYVFNQGFLRVQY